MNDKKNLSPKAPPLQEVTIDRLGKNAEGVTQIDDKTLFVQNALPGEHVSLKQVQKKRTYLVGKLDRVLDSSADRQDPICSEFSRCGGCQTMHMKYEAQLKFKQKLVFDALVRLGKLPEEAILHALRPTVSSPSPFHYRNKLQVAVANRSGSKSQAASSEGDTSASHLRIGMFAKGSHRIVSLENCHIHSKLGDRVYRIVSQALAKEKISGYNERKNSGFLRNIVIRTSEHTGQALVIFVTRTAKQDNLRRLANRLQSHKEISGIVQNVNSKVGNTVLGNEFITISGNGDFTEKLGDFVFHVAPGAFLQVNHAQAAAIYQAAIELAELKNDDIAIDAYCGIGTLTLFIAQKVKKVFGIESIDAAILNAQANAAQNKIENATFLAGKVEDLLDEMPKADVVFVDPPRKGCALSFLQKISSQAVRRIIYISCNPDTLARDAAFLTANNYTIDHLVPFDMFAQTAHVETLAIFTRRGLE